MKIIDRIGWGRRALVELRGIRRALEVIADHLGAAVAPDVANRSAFRSYYDDPKDESDLAYMDDEDRLAAEQKEQEELRRGGPAVEGFYEGDDERVGSVVGPTVAMKEEEEDAADEDYGGHDMTENS